MSKKSVGYKWESIAKDYYLQDWYKLLEQNRTIRWGELDLILEKESEIVFCEIKVVNATDDIFWYITKNKLNFLLKTIQYYIVDKNIDKQYRLDVVFIKDWKVFEIFKNIDL